MYFPSAPISFAVEITFACNNACSGCANALRARRHETLVDWKTVFDRIAPLDNRRRYADLIRITGGEPTLHPEFDQIIEYVDTFDIPHAIFTNGRWTHPCEIIRVLKHCRNFVGLLVSLHGSDADSHAAFIESDPLFFDDTCANIQRAADAGLDVFTNTVLTRANCEQIEAIIEHSRQLGAAHAVFNRYLGPPHPLEPDEEQLRRAVRLIERLRVEGRPCRIGDCIPPCFEPNASVGSNGGIEHCAISPAGQVRPDNLTGYAFGNLFEHDIEDIWRSDRAIWYRQQLPDQCRACVELPRCRGGARSVTIEHGLTGDRLMKAPITKLNLPPLELDPAWKPVSYFTVRAEPFGYLLCRYNWAVPVTREAKPLSDAIDGIRSLADIRQQFGDEALAVLSHLYREGCIGFSA